MDRSEGLTSCRTATADDHGALTVADLANRLLAEKLTRCKAGEIKLQPLRKWYRACKLVVEEFGAKQAVEDLTPDDFQRLMQSRLADKAAQYRSEMVTYVRALFGYAFNEEQRLISAPVLFGTAFRKPNRTLWHRNAEGRVFTSAQIRDLISYTKKAMRTAVLLGINCGFGNNDC